MQGRLVRYINKPAKEINPDGLSSGIYTVIITNNNLSNKQFKLIKK
jgi:hypothetical protein